MEGYRMKYIERERALPVVEGYDIIVAGSGPSGIAAAVTAGRGGAKVLLIEAQGSVGGISTTGMMSHFTGTVDSPLYWEILNRQREKCLFGNSNLIEIDPEALKNVYCEMLSEAKVDILLYSLVCGAVMEENHLRGVIVQNKSGRTVYAAAVVIDCTGDGDVAAYSGAEHFMGREEDGLMQPATLMFKVAGVDMERAALPGSFETTVETEKGELQALAKEKLPAPAGHVLLYHSPIPGIVTCNMTNVTGIDGTKAEDLTRAELICRSQMEPIVAFLREYVPGFSHCYLLSAASLIGIRETRHFKGVEVITEKDILTARQYENWVVRGAHFNFDVHNLTGAGLDATGVQHNFKQDKGYAIPYGCLVPEVIDGLLLSGRNISGTHMAHSNFRVMPICVGIGAAGGAAALLAVTRHLEVRKIPAREIQQVLLS